MILEKTCYWFKIDTKPNFWLPPPQVPPMAEFSYDEGEFEAMGLVGGRKRAQKKQKTQEDVEVEKRMMNEIDKCIEILKNKRSLNQGLKDTHLEVTDDKRLMHEMECKNALAY